MTVKAADRSKSGLEFISNIIKARQEFGSVMSRVHMTVYQGLNCPDIQEIINDITDGALEFDPEPIVTGRTLSKLKKFRDRCNKVRNEASMQSNWIMDNYCRINDYLADMELDARFLYAYVDQYDLIDESIRSATNIIMTEYMIENTFLLMRSSLRDVYERVGIQLAPDLMPKMDNLFDILYNEIPYITSILDKLRIVKATMVNDKNVEIIELLAKLVCSKLSADISDDITAMNKQSINRIVKKPINEKAPKENIKKIMDNTYKGLKEFTEPSDPELEQSLIERFYSARPGHANTNEANTSKGYKIA